MHGRVFLLAFSAALIVAPAATAQFAEDPPKLYVAKRAPTQKELDQRASLKQYALGLVCQREDRLLEALKAFEEAARLDPGAAAAWKAQMPLLLVLDRGRDAVAAGHKALALDADDFTTWFLSSRIHKSLGQFPEAQRALERGLGTKSVEDHPEIAQGMWLELASIHEVADELAPAIKALNAAAAILDHPDLLLEHGAFEREIIVKRAAETHERIGNLCRKAKRYPEAIAAYQKAQQRTGDQTGRLNFNLAQLCQEEGKHAEALVYVDAYLQRTPLGTEAHELKIQLLTKLKRDDQILPWLEKAIAADRFNMNLKMLLAQKYVDAKQLAQAEKLYLALADEAPSADVYQGLFRVHLQDAAGAVRTLELLDRTMATAQQKPMSPASAHAATQAKAMIAAVRDDGALAKDLVRAAYRQAERPKELQFDTVQLLAALADRNDLPAEAERFFRQALRAAPPSAEPLLYSGLLRALWKSRKYDDVLKLCHDGLASAKGTSHLLFHAEMAKAQARLGRHGEALRAADLAVAVAGESERLTLRLLRVRILTQAERYPQAEKESLALLKEHVLPGEAMEIHYVLSNVYNSWKKTAECEEQLQAVLKIDPSNATANNDLGYIWADQGKNLEQAEAMIRKALDLDRQQRKRLPGGNAAKDNAAYVDSLGWVLFRRGQIAEARRELERAAELPDGDDPVIWEHLGDVYQQLQMMSQARRAWEKAVRLYEQEHRRNKDDHYRELKRKLESITSGARN